MTFALQLAIQAHQNGRLAEAETLYRRAVAANPRNFDALHLLAVICSDTGKFGEADELFRRAIAADPNFPPVFVNYGMALSKQKRHAEALANFDKALAMFPNFAEAELGRGNVLRELRRNEDAVTAYNRAVALKPNLAEAYAGCAELLSELKRYDEAVVLYDKALALRPTLEFARAERLLTKMRLCDWRNLDAERASLLASLGSGVPAQPFTLIALLTAAEDQLRYTRQVAGMKFPPSAHPVWQGERYSHDRIRIGYFSSDFRNHATAHLLAGLIEQHDRAHFEVVGFCYGPDTDDAIRRRLMQAFDTFLELHAASDLDIARRAREMEIDIAVDLNGFTQGARTAVFAMRPAPVQVNYLGFPGTMGADYYDYIVADPVVVPAAQRPHYAEKVASLPHSYQINDSARPIADTTPSRAEMGLPDDAFVFCSFNNSFKITPAVFDQWMRILDNVDGSVLWLLEEHPKNVENLRGEAARRGIDPRRLIFAKRVSPADHLARHRCADLFLDTLPCNAHTTASDALWAGLPVLTQIGNTFAGRVAASCLTAVGLAELIANTNEEYERLATELARNREKLKGITQKLERTRLTAPLFDTALYTRHIEAAYEAMHRRHHAGLAADHIDIQAHSLRVLS